jgi:hypothetical protein
MSYGRIKSSDMISNLFITLYSTGEPRMNKEYIIQCGSSLFDHFNTFTTQQKPFSFNFQKDSLSKPPTTQLYLLIFQCSLTASSKVFTFSLNKNLLLTFRHLLMNLLIHSIIFFIVLGYSV